MDHQWKKHAVLGVYLPYRVIYDKLARTDLSSDVCFGWSTCLPPASEEATARYESSICHVSLQEANVYSSSRCALTFKLCNTQVRGVCVYVWVCVCYVICNMGKGRGRQREFWVVSHSLCFTIFHSHTHTYILFSFPTGRRLDTGPSITVNRAWDRWNEENLGGRWECTCSGVRGSLGLCSIR